MRREAVISDCGRYRYLLRREWDEKAPRILIVMLNPSTADAYVDDPTIRSCVRLCHKGLHAGSIEVVNLYAWRVTDPSELALASDPIGPRNDVTIEAAVGRCDMIVCAWGAYPGAANRSGTILNLLRNGRPAVFCWGKTKSGAPKHPLYIKTGVNLEIYR